jgi:uncharacterized protein (DUF58 family)
MFRAWWRTILGVLLVAGGVATAAGTWLAKRAGAWELARAGAIASLVFVALLSVFVVPPLYRAARGEARRFDPPVGMTGGGLVVLGLCIVVGLAAYNTGNNLLFLVFSVLTSTLFVAWSAGRASLRDLTVAARFPDHIFAGEPAQVLVSLRNPKRLLPSFSILVEARHQLPAEDETRRRLLRRLPRARYAKRALAHFTHVPRRARAEQRVEQVFPQRGHVFVTGFELSTRFPFGFFRLRRRLRARNVDLIIYPRLEPAGDELHLLPMNAGRLLSARRGAGHDLHSLREYQPQDDVRHIDWKATARAGHLVVREFASEDERRVHVVLDTRVREQGDAADLAARFERGVALAAAHVAHFLDESVEVRLTLGREAGEYGTGREHLYASLRRLALVSPDAPPRDTTTARRVGATDDEAAARGTATESGAAASGGASGAVSATTAGGAAAADGEAGGDGQADEFWSSLVPTAADPQYVILLTTAAPGTIPAHVWRASHVIYV